VERVLLDEVIKTDYGQFDLVWGDDYGFDGDFDRFFDDQVNGLAGAASGQGLYINLARRSGGSPVKIVLLQEAPAAREVDVWEDVVEVAIKIPHDAEPSWCTWAGEKSGPLDIPALIGCASVLADEMLALMVSSLMVRWTSTCWRSGRPLLSPI